MFKPRDHVTDTATRQLATVQNAATLHDISEQNCNVHQNNDEIADIARLCYDL